jgi:hypothetical protein
MKFFKNKKKKETKQIAMGTLYDLNKSIVEKNIDALSEEDMQNKKNLIIKFLEDTDNIYYMLLCNDRKDYTVFHHLDTNIECLQDVLIDECLPNRGYTKSIELTKNNDAIEIWISIDGDSYCYYFFPYDEAIIEC